MQDTAFELKFRVPVAARGRVVAELTRNAAAVERVTLAAQYLDTRDRHLARAGLSWRLRREGRRWIQTLKVGDGLLAREEHEVILAEPVADARLHAGTPAGERLAALLREAAGHGLDVGVRYRTDVRRTLRRVRTRGAIVEIAYDEGRLIAPQASARLHELEFELVSGDPAAMLGLVARWQVRHGLLLDPRRKSDRGDRLADGWVHPPVRKAALTRYPADADDLSACGSVLDECLAQILHNASALIDGDPALRVEHVHQLRVGIRRLRSALRCFKGWAPGAPADLLEALRDLFARLGVARDADVLDSGVAAALAEAGAPPIARAAATTPVVAPDAVCADPAVQRALLGWLAWRVTWTRPAPPAAASPGAEDGGAGEPTPQALGGNAVVESAADAPEGTSSPPAPLAERAARRLVRWHRRIADEANTFGKLPEDAIHDLRKRIKRQRYAAEFFGPLLRPKPLRRYLGRLAAAQESMGQLNDLYVARDRYRAVLDQDPAAWFALGWLAARIADAKAATAPALRKLARSRPPRAVD